MNVVQPLPEDTSEPSDAGEYARQLAQLLGPAYQPTTDSLVAADLLAIGEALADVQSNALDVAIGEAFADTTKHLLVEIEQSYGLAVRDELTQAERDTRLVTKIRASRGGSPLAIERAMSAYDPAAEVHEVSTQDVSSSVLAFVIAVTMKPSVLAAVTTWRELEELVRGMAPAHVLRSVCATVGFLTDDDDSLTDRDVLDA